MRIWATVLAPLVLLAQPPKPPYDPNDPEGIVMYANGGGRYAWKRKGTWTAGPLQNPWGNPSRVPPANAADLKQMTAVLDALGAIQRATKEGGEPVGYFMKESRTYAYPQTAGLPAGVTAARMPLEYSTGFYPFYIADTLRNGVFVPDKGGETESVYFYCNRLPGRFSKPVIAQEKGQDTAPVEFYLKPQVTATFNGLPVLEGQDLMIARQGREPWKPAPYGRVLKAAMELYAKDRDTAEQRLAGLKRKNDEVQSPAYEQQMRDYLEKNSGYLREKNPNNWKARLASMEHELKYNRERAAKQANPQRDKDGNWYWNPLDAHAEAVKSLAAMTPDVAARPACYLEAAERDGRYAIQGSILPAGAQPQCKELVTDNYDYFDSKLPRTAVQILLVHSLGRCAKVVNGKLIGPAPENRPSPPQGCYRHVPIWEQMDWSKVTALVAP